MHQGNLGTIAQPVINVRAEGEEEVLNIRGGSDEEADEDMDDEEYKSCQD